MGFIKFEWMKDDRDDKVLFESERKKYNVPKKRKEGFVLNWEEALDWESNPFKDEIKQPAKDFIAGRAEQKQTLNLFFIHHSRFGLIKGSSGMGKTMLLKWLGYELLNFQKKYIVCYLPAKELQFDEFLKKLVKTFSPVYKLGFVKEDYSVQSVYELVKKHGKGKEIVFLIDDLENVSENHVKLLKNIYTAMKDVRIIASLNPDTQCRLDVPMFGEDELCMDIDRMEAEEMIEMTERRIESVGGIDIDPFTRAQLKNIAKKSGFNPREFLKLANKEAIDLSLRKRHKGESDEVYDEPESEDLKSIEKDLVKHEDPISYETSSHEVEPATSFEGDRIVQEALNSSKKKSPKKKTKKK